MSWDKELEELKQRRALAAQLGGAEKVAHQKGLGKLTVRERIEGLVDARSFHEIGSIAGKASYDAEGKLSGFIPANLVMGRARIDGRPVAVAGDDFTVRDWGSLPVAGGLEAAYKAELEAASDPKAKLAEIEARLAKLKSPSRSAEAYIVEEIIDPRDTRAILAEFAHLAAPLRMPGPPSFGYRP